MEENKFLKAISLQNQILNLEQWIENSDDLMNEFPIDLKNEVIQLVKCRADALKLEFNLL